ncbi:MAG TPA: FAD-binding protein [Polyangiaceae bacterium]|nr:FAD-binding protein [Polyangiaceae bacterium]
MVSRRQVLAAAVGASVALGFDPIARSWVAAANAAGRFDRCPELEGELLTDPASLAAVASDNGNIIVNTPVAVLRPGSVRDVVEMVRFCRRRGIVVAARGQGHTCHGQSLAGGGLVIAMSSLNQIHSISARGADVDAGATWKSLLQASVPLGFTPPALTGYTNLSIAGTLSVGGVSATNRQGAQVDRVQALEVVTGEGDRVWCSECDERGLFEAALGGLGQCGIITRAVLDVIPAPEQARVFVLQYSDNAAFFRDFRELLRRGEFDGVYNIWVPGESGGFVYQLNAIKWFDAAHPPDDGALLRGIEPDAMSASDSPYLDQVLAVDAQIDFLRSIGLYDGFQHPWFDVFLPDSSVEGFVGDVLPTLAPDDVGPVGFLLLFALKRSQLTRPFLRVPERTEWVWLFDILTSAAAPGSDPEFVTRMLGRNRQLFEKARALGGTRYPIGALDFDQADWRQHYGDMADRFARLKEKFDPSRILTPGAGVF